MNSSMRISSMRISSMINLTRNIFLNHIRRIRIITTNPTKVQNVTNPWTGKVIFSTKKNNDNTNQRINNLLEDIVKNYS